MKDYTEAILAEYTAAANKATETLRCTKMMAIERGLSHVKNDLETAESWQLMATFGGTNWSRSYQLSPKEFYALAEIVLNELPLEQLNKFNARKGAIHSIWNMIDNDDYELVESVMKLN